MIDLKLLCSRLRVSQAELAQALGCCQANISHYRRGQLMPAPRAQKLIEFATARGVPLTFDHIFGSAPLPEAVPAEQSPAPKTEAVHV